MSVGWVPRADLISRINKLEHDLDTLTRALGDEGQKHHQFTFIRTPVVQTYNAPIYANYDQVITALRLSSPVAVASNFIAWLVDSSGTFIAQAYCLTGQTNGFTQLDQESSSFYREAGSLMKVRVISTGGAPSGSSLQIHMEPDYS